MTFDPIATILHFLKYMGKFSLSSDLLVFLKQQHKCLTGFKLQSCTVNVNNAVSILLVTYGFLLPLKKQMLSYHR